MTRCATWQYRNDFESSRRIGTDAVIITDDCVDIYCRNRALDNGAIFRQAVRITAELRRRKLAPSPGLRRVGGERGRRHSGYRFVPLRGRDRKRGKRDFRRNPEHLLGFSENTDERQGGVAERLRRRRDNCIFDEQSKINRLFVFSVYAAAYTGWLKPPY